MARRLLPAPQRRRRRDAAVPGRDMMRFNLFDTHGHFAPLHLGRVGWSLLLAAVIAVAPFVIWLVTRTAMLLGLAG
jgi:hypothetical protein